MTINAVLTTIHELLANPRPGVHCLDHDVYTYCPNIRLSSNWPTRNKNVPDMFPSYKM